MNSLATDIKQLLARRIQTAPASEILAIASNLCAAEILPELQPLVLDPTDRFMLNGAGDTISDRTTGLTWSKNNVPGGSMNWKKATDACTALELGGFKDWRLPTIRELLTLVDYERSSPAIDPAFECESNYYWTSTPLKSSPGAYAWVVSFSLGVSLWSHQGSGSYVRAVRSSQ